MKVTVAGPARVTRDNSLGTEVTLRTGEVRDFEGRVIVARESASEHVNPILGKWSFDPKLKKTSGAVDEYLNAAYASDEPRLWRTDAPPIEVPANFGKFLLLLARMVGAQRILEIGTLAGYSALWLARALPAQGKLVTLEWDPQHVQRARDNFAAEGMHKKIDLIEGDALETLPHLAPGFDLTFIDAGAQNSDLFFRHAVRLSHPGSVIVIDNVVRGGQLLEKSEDPNVEAVIKLHLEMVATPKVSITVLQTIGCKGYDGFAIALVE